jgi:hypothetical protein
MYTIEKFGAADMIDCRKRLRSLLTEQEPATLSDAAQRVVEFFYGSLHSGDGTAANALVRLFRTQLYEQLDPELQEIAAQSIGGGDLSGVRCLTLLATIGEKPEWNSAESSRAHRVIPLVSAEMVESAPMIAQLIRQFGLEVATVLKPDPGLLVDHDNRSNNVFHVAEARGNPYIPAQDDFVIPYRIESVLGFGGMLASGDLVAAVMFSKVQISRSTAELFSVIGMNLKLALLPILRSSQQG